VPLFAASRPTKVQNYIITPLWPFPPAVFVWITGSTYWVFIHIPPSLGFFGINGPLQLAFIGFFPTDSFIFLPQLLQQDGLSFLFCSANFSSHRAIFSFIFFNILLWPPFYAFAFIIRETADFTYAISVTRAVTCPIRHPVATSNT
jgi:hypothetical protein